MEAKKACLVHVAATSASVPKVRAELEGQGYEVCVVEAEEDEIAAVQACQTALPPALEECIASSDVCVFLLPADPKDDGLLGAGAGHADACGKPIIGVTGGDRAVYPEEFQDAARAMLRSTSEALPDALAGAEIWEEVSGKRIVERPFKTVRCQ